MNPSRVHCADALINSDPIPSGASGMSVCQGADPGAVYMATKHVSSHLTYDVPKITAIYHARWL